MDAIVVTPVAAAETGREIIARQPDPMRADGVAGRKCVRAGRSVYLHGLAVAAAILTCAAVTLNVGPFAKAPKSEGFAGEPATVLAAADPPNGSHPIAATEVDTPSAPGAFSSAPEPDGLDLASTLMQRWSVSLLEIAPAEFQPVAPQDGRVEVEAKPVRQEAGSGAPAPHLLPDHADADSRKKDAIVGVWAPDGGTCSARNFREGLLPTVLNTDGAWAGDTFCLFTKQQQTETGWRVVAKCQNPRERWTSNVRLTVSENRLTWASKRGTQSYTRCAPDVLMAHAR
jgi:hypothetical protein